MSETQAQTNVSWALNASNDIYLDDNGNLAIVTGEAAVSQDCLCAMKAQFNEMIYQPGDGLPTFADVWQSRNFIKWEAAARAKLATVPGVVRVVSFVLNIKGTTFGYTAQIETVYSPLLTISGVIGSQS